MARIRSQDLQTLSYCRFYRKDGAVLVKDVYEGPAKKGWSATMEDDPHPGYDSLVKSGQVVLGRMLRNVYELFPSSAILYHTSTYLGKVYVQFIDGDIAAYAEKGVSEDNTWQAGISNKVDIALVNAYAKIRDESIMSGEIMSGIGQTLSMLRRPFGSTRKLLKRCYQDARKSYRKTARSIAQANADAWLEYRYGMRPLFLDIKQGLNMYSQAERRLMGCRKVVRSAESFSYNNTVNFTDLASAATFGIKSTGNIATIVSGRCDAGVIFTISGRDLSASISEDLRLGVDSIAATGWELVPLSFVADWFVQVGPWLEAINLPPSVSVNGNWVTTIFRRNRVTTVPIAKFYNVAGSWTTGSGGVRSSYWNQTYRRINLSLPTYPPVLYRMPGVIQATDALALLTGPILGLLDKLKH